MDRSGWRVGQGGECLMFSGGMDSLIAACYLGIKRLVYVRLGHRYQFWEERVVKQLGDLLGIWVEIENGPSLTAWEQPSAFIPARNLVLALMGAYDHDRVWLALQKGETDLWDRSKEFCMETSRILSAHFAPREIEVDSPFWEMDKQEMVAWYVAQGHPVEWLFTSRSCYAAGEQECGDCPACFRKFVALTHNGIECEYHFATSPRLSVTAGDYRQRLAEYPDHRQKAMMEVMGW